MQKILKYVYLKSQTPHRHAKPEGFVYFQFIGKPINGTKEIDMLMLYVKFGTSVCVCVFFSFISLLLGQDFKFICSNVYCRLNASKISICFQKSSQN